MDLTGRPKPGGPSNMTYEIVRAGPEDAAAMAELRALSWQERYGNVPGIGARWLQGEIKRMTDPLTIERQGWTIAEFGGEDTDAWGCDDYFWRVAKTGHTIIGFVDAYKEHGRASQSLYAIEVAKEYRGRGIGQALMDAAHAWLEPRQAVLLTVTKNDHEAQAFFERPSNDYHLTNYTYPYGPLIMMQMRREARPKPKRRAPS